MKLLGHPQQYKSSLHLLIISDTAPGAALHQLCSVLNCNLYQASAAPRRNNAGAGPSELSPLCVEAPSGPGLLW